MWLVVQLDTALSETELGKRNPFGISQKLPRAMAKVFETSHNTLIAWRELSAHVDDGIVK